MHPFGCLRRNNCLRPLKESFRDIFIIHCPGRNKRFKKGKVSPYSITERKVLQLIPVLGSQPADDVSHKPGGRLPLLSAWPAVTVATLKRAAANFAAW